MDGLRGTGESIALLQSWLIRAIAGKALGESHSHRGPGARQGTSKALCLGVWHGADLDETAARRRNQAVCDGMTIEPELPCHLAT